MSNGGEYRFSLTSTPNSEDKRILHEYVMAFNDAVSVHHRNTRGHEVHELAAFIHDSNGMLVGGLVAQTYWGWLYIDDLWVHERLRERSFGRELMRKVEIQARREGCQKAYLKTFDFQARGFYEKLGYRVVGQLDDYPPGQIFYWMRKDFRDDNLITQE
jgi:ribosomal protein S18 acetylase RimI-like enzyme